MRSRGRRPYCVSAFSSLRKHQDVIIIAANDQAFLKNKAFKICNQCLRREVCRFGFQRFCRSSGSIMHEAEVILPLRRIWSIVLPVVPDRERNSIRYVGEKLTRQQCRLLLFTHPTPRG